MKFKSAFQRAAYVMWLALGHAWVSAANISVYPLRAELSQSKTTEVFTVRNHGNEPVVVQASVVKWSQKDGQEVLEPTREVLVAPAVIEVPGNETQIVRIAVRRPPDASKEDTFRLLIQEVPKRRDTKDVQIVFTLNISLPIFYAAASGPTQGSLDVTGMKASSNGSKKLLALDLSNTGSAHVQVTGIQASDEQGQVASHTSMFYLLPNQRRSVLINADRLPPGGRAVKLNVETMKGRVSKDILLN
jgi:fimbrial chaperone protein